MPTFDQMRASLGLPPKKATPKPQIPNNTVAPKTNTIPSVLTGFDKMRANLGLNSAQSSPVQIPKPSPNLPKFVAPPEESFSQKVVSFLDNVKTTIFGGFTAKEKAEMTPTPVKSTPIPTIKINGKNTNIPVSGLPKAPTPNPDLKISSPTPKLDKSQETLKVLEAQMNKVKDINPEEYNKLVPVYNKELANYNQEAVDYETVQNDPEYLKFQQKKTEEANYLSAKIDAAKIKPEEYFIRGITFGYAGDAGYNNKAPAVTLSQKGMELVGTIVGYEMLGGMLGLKAGADAKAITGGSLSKLGNLVAKHPWKVGYPLSVAKSAGMGTVGGAISKAEDINERVTNAINGGATFAAFDAIAFPVLSFFRPTFYSLGKGKAEWIDPKLKNSIGDANMKVVMSEPTELWFRHPEDPTILLKVNRQGATMVSAGEGTPNPNTLPQFTKTNVEMFKSKPSIYQKLMGFLKKEPVTITEGFIKGEISPEGTTPIKPTPQPVENPIKNPITNPPPTVPVTPASIVTTPTTITPEVTYDTIQNIKPIEVKTPVEVPTEEKQQLLQKLKDVGVEGTYFEDMPIEQLRTEVKDYAGGNPDAKLTINKITPSEVKTTPTKGIENPFAGKDEVAPKAEKINRKKVDAEHEARMAESARAQKEYEEKYPTFETRELDLDNQKDLIADEGDYVISHDGSLSQVTSGNSKYAEGTNLMDDNNVGYMRTRLFNAKEDLGYMDYANQMRMATPEELKQVGVDPSLAKPDKFLDEKKQKPTQKTNKPTHTPGGIPIEYVTKEELDKRITKVNNKDVTNKSNGQPNNNNIRGGTGQGKLSEAVPMGQRQPSNTGGTTAINSERMARGEDIVSNAVLGERSGEAITKKEQVEINKKAEELLKEDRTYTPEEQKILSQYSGAGGLEKLGSTGKGLLDEYYTPEKVVNLVWDKVKPLLPDNPKILEPAVGTGNFLKGAPEGSDITAYETSDKSAKITQTLYPEAKVTVAPFENIFVDERGNKKDFKAEYDLVIGNPPYGEHRGIYKGLGEENKIAKYEEYFIKRALDLTKEGGYVAMVIPSGFLRGGNILPKKIISQNGLLIGATRLPNGTFDTTDIGTDIVIFRKTSNADSVVNERAEEISNDNYFKEHPEEIMGVEKERKGRFGMEKYVEAKLEPAVAENETTYTPVEETKIDKVAEEQGITDEQKEITDGIKDDIESGAIGNVKEFEKEYSKPVNPKTPAIPKQQQKGVLIKTPKKTKNLLDLGKFYDTSKIEIDIFKNINSTGEVDSDFVKTLTPEQKQQYLNLQNGEWFTNFDYFSGDIYTKLDQLKKDFPTKDKQYNKQKVGLDNTLPAVVSIDRINIAPNTPFADMKIKYEDKEMTLKSAFIAFMRTLPDAAFGQSSRWEIGGYVNEQSVRGGDKLKNQSERENRRRMGNKLFSQFLKEGLPENLQSEITEEYNRKYNGYSKPDYSKVPLQTKLHSEFKGKELDIKDVQRQGVGFLTNKGVAMLAHDVGLGKTMQIIISVHETMKKGWAKKPLIVVPGGNVYGQWIKEIQELIPGVEINSLANLGGDFKGDLASLTINDGSISIMTYEGMKRLGFKDSTYNELTKDLQDVIGDETATKRGAEKQKAKVEETIGKAKKGTKTEKFFEDLGFDLIAMDEAHNANHIIKGAKLAENGKSTEFRGLSVRPSDLGVKTWLASQYILKNNNGRNVYLASATPFTNNPMEYYSVLSLMARDRFNKMGIKNVNDFMNTFMDLTTEFEATADGKWKEKNNIRGFKNYQQFQNLLSEVIDFRDGEEAGVVRPERVPVKTVLKPTALQIRLMEETQELFTPKFRKEGGTLKGIGEMKKTTFSPYASNYYKGTMPTYKEFVDNSPKIKAVMEMVKQVHLDNKDANQVIYSPLGLEFFPHIKEYLIREGGFKPNEVAIISGAVSKTKRVEIQEQFNEGKIKVIIGSDAIQEGVNLQKKTTDLYVLSLPWNFTELKQVVGRVWRQGNEWKKVRIHDVYIENSVDVFLAQKLETKQKRYEEALKFKGDYLDVGDIDYEELKMDLIKSPLTRVEIQKSMESKNLEKDLGEAQSNFGFYSRKVEQLNDLRTRIDRKKSNLINYKKYELENPDDQYYKDRVTEIETEIKEATVEYEEATRVAIERGVLDPEKLKMFSDKVEEVQKKQLDLEEKYKVKLAEATKEEELIKTGEVEVKNDYNQVSAKIAEQNKTFFQKVEPKTTKRVPSGMASNSSAKMGAYEKVDTGIPETGDKLKLFEEVKVLIKKYAKTIGEGYLPRGAAGVYYPDTENIRVTGMNALSLATHEITHFLDKRYKIVDVLMGIKGRSVLGNPIYEGETAPFRKEMTRLYTEYYPGGRKQHKLRKRMEEGFAMLLEKYIEQPTAIKAKYPNLVEKFLTTEGEYYQPVMGDIINDLRDIVSRYQNLNPLEKINARIMNDKTNVDKESFLNFAEYVKYQIADIVYPIEKLAKKIGISLTKKDPSVWVRQYSNSNTFILNNIKKVGGGYWGFRDGELTKLHDYNWADLIKKTENEQKTEEFGAYLIARDQYFQFKDLESKQTELDQLREIVSSENKSKKDIEDYKALSKEVDKLNKVLENNSFTEAEVTEAYLQNKDNYTELEDMFDTLTKEDLNFLNDPAVQLLDKDSYTKLSLKEGYASMKRNFYDEIQGEYDIDGKPTKMGTTKVSSLLGRKGSQRAIINPLASGLTNHAEITRKGLKQIVYNTIGNLSSNYPQLFQEQQLKSIPDSITGIVHFPQEKDPNIIMARKGYKKLPILTDKLIKSVLDDILTYQNIGIFEKLLLAGNRFFTKGTTGLFPGFALTNYAVDQVTAVAQTRNNYIPLYDPLSKLFSALDKNNPNHDYFQEYMVMGGERQTFVGWQDLSPNELFSKIENERKGLLRIIDLMNKGVDILAIPSKYSEIATRATEYIKSREKGNSAVVAMEEAGRVTAPFHHIGKLGGKFGQVWAKAIPFFNPGIQVLAQTAETLETPKGRQRFAWTVFALTAASISAMIGLLLFGSDDQKKEFQDKQPDELGGYIWFPLAGGVGLGKVRVPNQMAVFATIINMAIADKAFSAKYTGYEYLNAGTNWVPQQFDITNPERMFFGWLPQLIKPGALTLAGVKDFPAIMPLESQSQMNKSPGLRTNETTSIVAEQLGKMFNISPIKIDYLVTGYLGRASGFAMGKPGIYNPLSSLSSQYYFQSGRKLQMYYDLKEKNDQEYYDLMHGLKNIKPTEVLEILDQKQKLKIITDLMSAYKEVNLQDTESAKKIRNAIINEINKI